jgi:hypothetical protein
MKLGAPNQLTAVEIFKIFAALVGGDHPGRSDCLPVSAALQIRQLMLPQIFQHLTSIERPGR